MNIVSETFTRVFRNAADNAELENIDITANDTEESSLPENMKEGENGCLEYPAEELDSRLAMFAGFVRNIPSERNDELLSTALDRYRYLLEIDPDEANKFLCDIFVLALEKRDCREGEKEKDIFYHTFVRLYSEFPHIGAEMLRIIPEYGSWNDPWKIIEYMRTFDGKKAHAADVKPVDKIVQDDEFEQFDQDDELFANVVGREGLRRREFISRYGPIDKTLRLRITYSIIQIISGQFADDMKSLEEDKPVSLLGKWLPSERGAFCKRNRKTWKAVVEALVGPNSSTPEKDYREAIGKLRNKIDIPESKMCAGEFSKINPANTPSVCASKHRKAFLNVLTEKQAEERDRDPGLQEDEKETGNRFPDNPDRVDCRRNWLNAIKEKKIKGGQMDPQSLVRALLGAATSDEIALVDAQYEDLLKITSAKVEKAKLEGFEPMDNIIPMIDLSESMNGGPKEAAIGLGIMLSQLNAKDFGGLVMIFADNPQILDLSKGKTFSEKVAIIRAQRVGYTTNFHLAIERIRDIVKKFKIPEEQVPSLCVLTDMQFNDGQMGHKNFIEVNSKKFTMEEHIAKMFYDVGMKVSGKPYGKPRTIHWNLRGDTDGFAATTNDQNVQMLAGYSPALFDLILCGKPNPTPYETMRRKLDSARYDPVRECFRRAIELNNDLAHERADDESSDGSDYSEAERSFDGIGDENV